MTDLWPVADDGPFAGAFADDERKGEVRPLVQYQRDPVGFMVDVLGMDERTLRWSLNPGYESHRWDGTPDPLVAALEGLADWRDVGVEAGTGTQKTYVLGAGGTLWFLACFPDAVVVTVAPKEDQLKLNLWKELGKLWPRFKQHFPTAALSDLKLRIRGGIDESWAASGFVAGVGADEESANKARGFHAEHMLIIFEEMPGIHTAIATAFENTCTAPHNIRLGLGNPDNQQDQLHTFCETPGVLSVRISALDHPNVVAGDENLVPGAASKASNRRRALKYGENSRMYDRMVRGISPAEAEDALIHWDWCVSAWKRFDDERFRVGLPALGVDVANSENGDKAALAKWQGACLTEVTAQACPDASVLGVEVCALMREGEILAAHVGVDSVGVGASTVNKLKELGKRVKSLNGGSKAYPMADEDLRYREGGVTVMEEERYNNLRSQMWWALREDLRIGRIALPNDEELWRDLTTPTYRTLNGKIIVESKEEIKKRLGRSPDKGDAAVYGNWVRRRKPLDPPAAPPKNRNQDNSGRLEEILAAAQAQKDHNPMRLGRGTKRGLQRGKK